MPCVSVSTHPDSPGASIGCGRMAELYFPNESGWSRYRETISPDGMEQWVDPDGTLVLRATTEMIGLP